MDRIVYLFELDSVQSDKTNDDNKIYETDGVTAMFEEIIGNGNTVAVSMNQLSDSRFFAKAIADDFTYPILCRLFEAGALRVSLYGKIRTASQYIQQAVQKCLDDNNDSFVFSNLPVSCREKPLLQMIQNALKYSDLSELQNLRDQSEGEDKQKIEYICRYISMVLNISLSETGNIPPRSTPSKGFEFFLKTATEILKKHKFADKNSDIEIKNAVSEIEQRSDKITEERGNRSNWLYLADGQKALSDTASDIINICYNYTVEDSINGVSRHYDSADFENSFANDLIRRTEKYCCYKTEPKSAPLSKRRWKMALRFAGYRKASAKTVTGIYQDGIKVERQKWKFRVFGRTLLSCGWACLYIALFILTELLLGRLENHIILPFDNLIFSSVISILLVGIMGSVLNLALSKIPKKEMPDILESISDIFLRLYDLIYILIRR